MRLSKEESKYRIKFIQEHHYNKSEQRQFDQALIDLKTLYKDVYCKEKNGDTYMFMLVISANRASKSFEKFGSDINRVSKVFENFGYSMSPMMEICEHLGGVNSE